MEAATSKASTGRKRQREQESSPETEAADQSVSLEDNLIFSDTLVALRMMRSQFPRIEKVSIQPFILRSQLYSSVKDRTQVDRELESLKRECIIRVFKLNTGQDDHAVMFVDDYQSQIERAVKRLQTKRQDDLTVFDWFKTHVIPSKLDPSIGHQELVSNLLQTLNVLTYCLNDKRSWLTFLHRCMEMILCAREYQNHVNEFFDFSLLSLVGKVKEEHISLLINAGLLTRQLIDPNMYWFAIPNIGSVLKGLSQGRKELLSFLNRRKYKEMMLALLEKKRLHHSLLDMRFHLRDLIGSGHLKTIQTPSGLVVRIAKD